MTVPTILARKINPFFIYRSGDDDPWTDGPIHRKPKAEFSQKRLDDNANKKKKKRKRRFECDHLRDFMHATSMHGLKYAAEKEASWIERYITLKSKRKKQNNRTLSLFVSNAIKNFQNK